jgi:hypothetical protein
MTDHPARRYSEKEVRWLMKRVGELQRSSDMSNSNPTLADLESIAQEAGFDPTLIRQAAREMEAAPTSVPGNWLTGAPLSIVLERTIPYEIDDALYGRLAGKIENAGVRSMPGSMPDSFTWRSDRSAGGRTTLVRINVSDGVTTIRIEETYGNLAAGLFGGVLGGVGGGLGIGAGTAIAFALRDEVLLFALPALVIGTTYAAVRAGFKGYVRKRQRALQQLLEDIEAVLKATGTADAAKLRITGAEPGNRHLAPRDALFEAEGLGLGIDPGKTGGRACLSATAFLIEVNPSPSP